MPAVYHLKKAIPLNRNKKIARTCNKYDKLPPLNKQINTVSGDHMLHGIVHAHMLNVKLPSDIVTWNIA